jgi:hypothetical protein
LKDADQFASLASVVHGKEGDGGASATTPTCSTYTMDVIFDVGREIVVDNKFDILDIYREKRRYE